MTWLGPLRGIFSSLAQWTTVQSYGMSPKVRGLEIQYSNTLWINNNNDNNFILRG